MHIFVIHLYPWQLHYIILSFVFSVSDWSITIHLHFFVCCTTKLLCWSFDILIYIYVRYHQDNIFGKKFVWRQSNFCNQAGFHSLYCSSWFVTSGLLVQFRCCMRMHVFVSVPNIIFLPYTTELIFLASKIIGLLCWRDIFAESKYLAINFGHH